eukprot:1580127-Rhodomonas_salina.4
MSKLQSCVLLTKSNREVQRRKGKSRCPTRKRKRESYSIDCYSAYGQHTTSRNSIVYAATSTAPDHLEIKTCNTTRLDTCLALSQASGQRQISQSNRARCKPGTVSGLGPETDFTEQQG